MPDFVKALIPKRFVLLGNAFIPRFLSLSNYFIGGKKCLEFVDSNIAPVLGSKIPKSWAWADTMVLR